MKKNLLVFFILCSALITESLAQGRTVSGRIISQDDGEGWFPKPPKYVNNSSRFMDFNQILF